MTNHYHTGTGATSATSSFKKFSPDDKSLLVSYLIRQPDELSMHCLALTKATLDSDDMMYREVLLFALIERQICLAKELDALADNQLGGVDDRLDKLIKQYYQQYEEPYLLAPPSSHSQSMLSAMNG